jgi:hypothetical protein
LIHENSAMSERGAPRDEAAKDLLALDQRSSSKIPTFEGEDVERDEGRIAAPEHELVETRPTLRVLAIEHRLGIHLSIDEQR